VCVCVCASMCVCVCVCVRVCAFVCAHWTDRRQSGVDCAALLHREHVLQRSSSELSSMEPKTSL